MNENIKNWLKSAASTTIIFSAIYLAAWFYNGYCGGRFSCGDLMMLYTAVIVKQTAQHTINSVYNSPKGIEPGQPQQQEDK